MSGGTNGEVLVTPDPWEIEALLKQVEPESLRQKLSDAIDDRIADAEWDAAWNTRHELGGEG